MMCMSICMRLLNSEGNHRRTFVIFFPIPFVCVYNLAKPMKRLLLLVSTFSAFFRCLYGFLYPLLPCKSRITNNYDSLIYPVFVVRVKIVLTVLSNTRHGRRCSVVKKLRLTTRSSSQSHLIKSVVTEFVTY